MLLIKLFWLAYYETVFSLCTLDKIFNLLLPNSVFARIYRIPYPLFIQMKPRYCCAGKKIIWHLFLCRGRENEKGKAVPKPLVGENTMKLIPPSSFSPYFLKAIICIFFYFKLAKLEKKSTTFIFNTMGTG